MSKKPKRKWNRANTFSRQKSNHDRVGHPALIYGESGRLRKYLLFTHTPEVGKESEYERLNHNIDPNEKDQHSYVKKRYFVSDGDSFEAPPKKYRIHPDDAKIVKKYKK